MIETFEPLSRWTWTQLAVGVDLGLVCGIIWWKTVEILVQLSKIFRLRESVGSCGPPAPAPAPPREERTCTCDEPIENDHWNFPY